jgi:hypothetical protein
MAAQKTLVLVLHGLIWLNTTQRNYVITYIKRDLKPIVDKAGRILQIKWGKNSPDGELNIYFEKGEKPKQACGFEILGDDNSGYVSIAGHLHLRVCGPSNPVTGKRDTRKVLTTDQLFSQALANTALHELGHFIADLEDNLIPGNFMSTGGPKGGQRTLQTMRKYFGARLQWSQKQKEKLISCLRSGVYLGDSIKFG